MLADITGAAGDENVEYICHFVHPIR